MNGLSLRLSRQSALFAAGSVASLVGLVASSVVAARVMGTEAFSAYAALVSVIGVLGTGVAGALEQETARRATVLGSAMSLADLPVRHAGGAVGLATMLSVIPAGWQEHLFGAERTWIATLLIVVGVVGLHAAALARGLLAATGARARLGVAVGLTGVLPVLLGPGLAGVGVSPFVAFGVGTVVGGGSSVALAATALRNLATRARPTRDISSRLGELIAANLFLTANMVAVPAVLRSHVEDLSAPVVASLQIVVSLSRLSTLLVSNGVSLVVAVATRDRASRLLLLASGGAAALGLAAVVGSALLAPWLLPWVFGQGYGVAPGTAALAAASVVFLNPAYVLTGVAVARGRQRLLAVAWAGGAAVLAAVALWTGPLSASGLLVAIALSAVIPAGSLLATLRRHGPAGEDSGDGPSKDGNRRAQ